MGVEGSGRLREGYKVEHGRQHKGEGDNANAAVDVHEVAEKRDDDGNGHRADKKAKGNDAPPDHALLPAAIAQHVRLPCIQHRRHKHRRVDAVRPENMQEQAGVGECPQRRVRQIERHGRLRSFAIRVEPNEPLRVCVCVCCCCVLLFCYA